MSEHTYEECGWPAPKPSKVDATTPATPEQPEIARLRAQLAEAQQQRDQMREALARVRAHTAWTIPADGEVVRLLAGLLGSIERIAEAALAKESGRWRSRSVISGSTGA